MEDWHMRNYGDEKLENCDCDNPDPDMSHTFIPSKGEGHYNICKNCGSRIWK